MENLSSIKHVLEEDQKLTGTVYEDIDASTDKISASLADLNEKITTVSNIIHTRDNWIKVYQHANLVEVASNRHHTPNKQAYLI